VFPVQYKVAVPRKLAAICEGHFVVIYLAVKYSSYLIHEKASSFYLLSNGSLFYCHSMSPHSMARFEPGWLSIDSACFKIVQCKVNISSFISCSLKTNPSGCCVALHEKATMIPPLSAVCVACIVIDPFVTAALLFL
jgi:hypothetical protein